MVEDIDDVEAEGQRLIKDRSDLTRKTKVDLRVGRDMRGVGEAATQSTAIDHADGAARSEKDIGCPRRAGPGLGVIRVDVMARDVIDLIWIEEELVRRDLRPSLARPCKIGVGAKIASREKRFQLDARIIGAIVIEGRLDIGLAKLSVIQKVARPLVIDVDAGFELRRQFLRDPRVEIIRPFRANGA